MATLPGLAVTESEITEGIEQLLRTEDWDTITVKVVLRRLEAQLLPDQPEALKPHKKIIKEVRTVEISRRHVDA